MNFATRLMARSTNRPLQRTVRQSAACLSAVLLAACSSAPPPRFHTLVPNGPLAAANTPASAVAWQLPPISIPPQVDQPQFVLRRADNTLAVLEQERWIAPLQDELRAALLEQLSALAGAPGARPRPEAQDWRVMVEVRRLDSTPGRTLLTAQWALIPAAGAAPALRCMSQFENITGQDIPALAQGHRLAVQQLAQAIGDALLKADQGKGIACP